MPIRNRAQKHWMCSPKKLIENVLVGLRLPRDALPPHRRSINMPGFAVAVQDMLDALAEVGGKDKFVLVKEQDAPEPNPVGAHGSCGETNARKTSD